MASECVEADAKSSAFLKNLELNQSWWMYPIARFFGHALYGMNREPDPFFLTRAEGALKKGLVNYRYLFRSAVPRFWGLC